MKMKLNLVLMESRNPIAYAVVACVRAAAGMLDPGVRVQVAPARAGHPAPRRDQVRCVLITIS
jgi:hypothetical protein